MAGAKEIQNKALASTLERLAGPGQKVVLGRFHESGGIHVSGPLSGSLLSGRYRMKEKIGQGGMGTVYLAEDERIGKKVAVKVLPDTFREPTVVSRFIQEAKLAPRIEHENVVDVTDLGTTVQGTPYYVMEYLRGTDLGTVLREGGRLPWGERAKSILLQMCRGLGAAHRNGIIHRDMKPDNVFLAEREDNPEFVKLLDFGIAKLLESAVDEGRAEAGTQSAPVGGGTPGLTLAGTVMGTPQYMAPEQGTGRQVDHRADIYSVGTIMYHMLTGEVPFDEKDMSDKFPMAVAISIVNKHVSAVVVPPRELCPGADIPEEVEAIVMRALQKEPDSRFSAIKEMEEALEACRTPDQGRARRRSMSMPAIKRAGDFDGRTAIGRTKIRDEEARRSRSRLRRAIVIGALVAATGAAAVLTDGFRHLHFRNFTTTTQTHKK